MAERADLADLISSSPSNVLIARALEDHMIVSKPNASAWTASDVHQVAAASCSMWLGVTYLASILATRHSTSYRKLSKADKITFCNRVASGIHVRPPTLTLLCLFSEVESSNWAFRILGLFLGVLMVYQIIISEGAMFPSLGQRLYWRQSVCTCVEIKFQSIDSLNLWAGHDKLHDMLRFIHELCQLSWAKNLTSTRN